MRLRTFYVLLLGNLINTFGTLMIPWEKIKWDGIWIGISIHAVNIVFTLILIRIFFPDFKITAPKERLKTNWIVAVIVVGFITLPRVIYHITWDTFFYEVGFGLLFTFFIGLDEELFSRKFMFAGLLEGGFYSAIFISAAAFGLEHLMNLRGGGQTLDYTLAQVVSAGSFGVLACALYLSTGKLIVPIMCHALYDLPWQLMPNAETDVLVAAHADWTFTLIQSIFLISIGMAIIFFTKNSIEVFLKERFPSLIEAD